MTSAYHPQTNLTERVNRTLKTMVASYVGNQRKQWDKYLRKYQSSGSPSTQQFRSPLAFPQMSSFLDVLSGVHWMSCCKLESFNQTPLPTVKLLS